MKNKVGGLMILLCAICTYTSAQIMQSTIVKQTAATATIRPRVTSVVIAGTSAANNDVMFTATINSIGTGTIQYKWTRTCSNCSQPSPSGGLIPVPPAVTTGTLILSGTGLDTVTITTGKPRALMHIVFETITPNPVSSNNVAY